MAPRIRNPTESRMPVTNLQKRARAACAVASIG
jgi:hypothetical protein